MHIGPVLQAGLVSFLVFSCALPSQTGDRLLKLRGKVWRVNPQGQIIPLTYHFPSGSVGMAGFGDTLPLPSPDGRWVVFRRDSNLRLLDVGSGEEQQITCFGRPYKWPYASVEVLVASWSNDSQRLLFAVVHGETDCPTEDCPHDWEVREAAYGFYVHDLRIEVTQRVSLPDAFRFAAWLPDGRFLGTTQNPNVKPCQETLLMFQPGEAQGTPIRAPGGWPTQVQVSADGKWAVGSFDAGCDKPEMAQILKIELATKTAMALTPLFPWAENQLPMFSPAGGHVSYTHRDKMVEHNPQESLIVDGRTVYSCQGALNYEWVDEHRVGLACRDEVIILDVVTRAASSHYSLLAGSPSPNR